MKVNARVRVRCVPGAFGTVRPPVELTEITRSTGPVAVELDAEPGRVFGFQPGELRELPAGSDRLGNRSAQEGVDRCYCGCKYWEFDCCIDCGAYIGEVRSA